MPSALKYMDEDSDPERLGPVVSCCCLYAIQTKHQLTPQCQEPHWSENADSNHQTIRAVSVFSLRGFSFVSLFCQMSMSVRSEPITVTDMRPAPTQLEASNATVLQDGLATASNAQVKSATQWIH